MPDFEKTVKSIIDAAFAPMQEAMKEPDMPCEEAMMAPKEEGKDTTTFALDAIRVLRKAEESADNATPVYTEQLVMVADRYIRLAEIDATHGVKLT